MTAPSGTLPFMRLVARERDPARLVALLHQAACDAVGASVSVLLRASPLGGGWTATSASGLETLALGPWLEDGPGAAVAGRAFSAEGPVLVRALGRDVPELAARLGGAESAVLVPLLSPSLPPGLLILAAAESTVDLESAATAGDAFVLGLERAATADDLALAADVRALLQTLARDGSSPVALSPALDAFCRGMVRLVAADHASIWIHDRRARELVHAAGSDARPTARPGPIPASDQVSPIAAALRRDGAELLAPTTPAAGLAAVVTLRGRRRALGVLALEGVRVEPGGEVALLDRCHEIGRQLSAVLENVQLLDEIVRSRAELQNVFDSLSELVVVVSAGGLVADFNRAFSERLGLGRDALVDRPVGDVLSGALLQWVDAHRTSDRRTDHGVVDDDRLDGRFELTLTRLDAVEPGEAGHVLVARDVTTATRFERERAELERRLSHSQKLLALGQFVAGVAHELNNPLQGVLGHLELVRRGSRLSPALSRDLALVYREAERAARIVRNLLVFAGSGRLTRRRVSLNRTVSRVLRLRAPHLRAANIDVVRELDEAAAPVTGDGLLLQQALLNLVVNAEQAMAGRGRLLLKTERVESGGVRVTIADSGPGVPEDVRSRLFEPFFTTRADAGGTGLGLAIVYGIVKAHGGGVDVVSSPGAGASFRITLPPAARRNAKD